MKIKIVNNNYIKILINDNTIKKELFELLTAEVPGYQYNYNYKIGAWDGKERFFRILDKGIIVVPFGFKDVLKEKFNPVIINEDEFIFDKIKNIDLVNDLKEYIKNLNLKFEIRDYQFKSIYLAIKYQYRIFEIATGGGKSLVQSIIMKYLYDKFNLKSILIVPTVSLVEQFYSDLISYFGEEFKESIHLIYSGKEKHLDKPVTITTWQSISKIKDNLKDIDVLICDEVHTAKNSITILAKDIIPSLKNAKYKLGFTGTIPIEKNEYLSLVSNFGKIENILKARDLIKLGYGSEIIINGIIFEYEKLNNLPKKYLEQKKFFSELEIKNDKIIDLVLKIYKKFGKSLILVNSISQGKILIEKLYKKISKYDGEVEFIPSLPKNNKNDKILKITNILTDKKIENVDYLEKYNIFYIYGAVNVKDREYIRNYVEKNNSIIIANYKTFSTGINIKSLKNLILINAEKSFFTIVQSIGRMIRKTEEKTSVGIFDIVDSYGNNYDMKQYSERIQIYKNEGHKFNEKYIKIEDNFEINNISKKLF